jgi:hypothetical protein
LRSRVAKIYTDLHEGQAPDKFVTDPPLKQPKFLVSLGRIPEFVYFKRTTDGVHGYEHKVELPPEKQPILAHDENGKLHIVNQKHITVTAHGIEDKVAHKRGIMRANPAGKLDAKKVTLAILAGGAVGAAALMLTDLGMQKLAPPGLNPFATAGIKAGLAIAGAIGLDYAGQETMAAGLGISMMAVAIQDAVDQAKTQLMPAGAVYLPQGYTAPVQSGYYSYAS